MMRGAQVCSLSAVLMGTMRDTIPAPGPDTSSEARQATVTQALATKLRTDTERAERALAECAATDKKHTAR